MITSFAAVLSVPEADAGDGRLIAAAALGIAAVVLLIAVAKLHPFLSLMLGSGVLGLVAGLGLEGTLASFSAGVGSTTGSVGLLIALGAMIGGLLADTGAADGVVRAVVDRVPDRALPWGMAGVAALLGLPLFFEVGVVLLVPIVLLVAHRTRVPLIALGIPALAGLSVLHGLVPPHPGPLVAIAALKADVGLTSALGIVVALPTVVLAGPLFGRLAASWVHAEVPPAPLGQTSAARTPGVRATVATVLLPVMLMLVRALGELLLDPGDPLRSALHAVGSPIVALLAGVLAAMLLLGARSGMGRARVSTSAGAALSGVAGILLIVAAGGGFKQTLVDAGVGKLVGDAARDANLSPLLLGWLVAVGIRLVTGSATVATITASGIVAPLAAGLGATERSLLVLAIGAGSLFFSHVNDAGFWLVKEYFGLTVGQTLKSWSAMETVISLAGLAFVSLLSLLL